MKRAASVIHLEKDKILDNWEVAVRGEVAVSDETSSLVLRNNLYYLLEDIQQIMENYYERFPELKSMLEKDKFLELFRNSVEHGRHRSTTSNYTIDQILREYIVFHQVVTNELLAHDVFTTETGLVLKYSIEYSMLYAVSAFNDSMEEMRQKLVGILAHDMRNPLSAAKFALDIMNHEDESDKFERFRSMALNSIGRATEMVEDLLESVSVKAGEGLTLNFLELELMHYLHLVHHEASQIYSNKIHLEADKKEINGIFDGVMISRVLENLVNNAVKYGSRNSPVTITVKETEELVSIHVHNQGEPIPLEKQNEIFEFLHTSSRKGPRGLKSHGMGLTLVQAVVEGHGGKLELKSSKAEGTVFSIYLDKFRNKPGKREVGLQSTKKDDAFDF